MKNRVYISDNAEKVKAKSYPSGNDGATWFSGEYTAVEMSRKGDHCFNGATFDIHRCIEGGKPGVAKWEFVCNLNNLEQIKEFIGYANTVAEELIAEVRNNTDKAIKELVDSPANNPWWFGTREEFNALTEETKGEYVLFFIEEGT